MSMTTTTVQTPTNARLLALREKHQSLSEKVESAQKDLSSSDFYLSQLKKQKLVAKEKLVEEERRAAS